MLAGRFTGEYPFFRGAPATMAGVSAAWSFDRFFVERLSPPVKEEQGQPLQQQKGHGKEDGLERGEEVCHAAEDATVKFMHIEQGVDEVGGQGVYADNAEGKYPLGPFSFVPHINGQMKQGKKRQGNAGGGQDEGPCPHAFNDGVGAVQHPGGAEKEKARSCHCRAEAHGGEPAFFQKLSRYPSSHAQGGGGNDAERAFRVKNSPMQTAGEPVPVHP